MSGLGGHSHRAVHRKQRVGPSHVSGMLCVTERQPKSRAGSKRGRGAGAPRSHWQSLGTAVPWLSDLDAAEVVVKAKGGPATFRQSLAPARLSDVCVSIQS